MRPVRAAIASVLVSAALVWAAAPRLYLQSSSDRQAFCKWFTFMAESRYYAHKRVREISSCAALVRWAFRQALLPHDAAWARSTDLPVFPAMRSVEEFDGSGGARELNNAGRIPAAFSGDVSTLQRDATWFVARELAAASPGDLLFFRGSGGTPEHVMIYVGPSQIVPSDRKWVVYATDSGREIRKICIDELAASTSAELRASADNESFLGVWRLNILRDAP